MNIDPEFQNQLLLTFGLVSVFIFLTWIVQARKRRQKNGIYNLPGPRQYFLGGIGNLLELSYKPGTIKCMLKWCSTYGPIFQVYFGPIYGIALNSAPYIQKLYGSSDLDHLSKSFMYDLLKPVWQDGLAISKGEKWKSRRKLLTHVVTFKCLKSYMTIFNREGKRLTERFDKVFDDGKVHPINETTLSAALSVIIEATLGINIFEANDVEGISEFVRNAQTYKEIATTRLLKPWLLINPIWRFHPLSIKHDKAVASLHAFARKVIEERKQSYSKERKLLADSPEDETEKVGKSLIEELIEANIPDEGIVEEVMTSIGAGYETSGITLHFLLFFLALNPEHQELCREEADYIFDSDLCPDGNVTFDALSKLKHLERCILETLRLVPPVFIIMRKITAPLKLDENLEIPANTNVAVPVQGIHRNPEYYPDPDIFDPDRFLPENSQTRNQYSFMAFAGGPRKCIGYKFSLMELSVLTAMILRKFEISTIDKWETITLLPDVTLIPNKPLNFQFRRRATNC
ncbi:Cytochrome P450 4C1 [Orchesella cincta]|uniref:Cytochrome P450 4C1 n=1 Tax=Orchesella cincta TaxID=48709 RepID=A0A1D2NGW2_ORCCI|nr:Cytochrome P450 4C1 [Orchesella cincta]